MERNRKYDTVQRDREVGVGGRRGSGRRGAFHHKQLKLSIAINWPFSKK